MRAEILTRPWEPRSPAARTMFYQNVPRRGVRNPRELNRTWHVSAVVPWQFRSLTLPLVSASLFSFFFLSFSRLLSPSHRVTSHVTPRTSLLFLSSSIWMSPISLFPQPLIDKHLFCVTPPTIDETPIAAEMKMYIHIGNGQLIPHVRISILPMKRTEKRKKHGQLSTGLKLHRRVKHRPRSL